MGRLAAPTGAHGLLEHAHNAVEQLLQPQEKAVEQSRLQMPDEEQAGKRDERDRQAECAGDEEEVHLTGHQHGNEPDGRDHEDGGEVADLGEDSTARGLAGIAAFPVGVVDDEGHARGPREQAEGVDEHQREDEHHVVPKARGMAHSIEGRIVGGSLHEVARQHEDHGQHQRNEGASLQRIDKCCQVVGVANEKAHGHDAQ